MHEREPPRPGKREQHDAYAAGRIAKRTGKKRSENPEVMPQHERTTRSDMLSAAWYAGYDFEVC